MRLFLDVRGNERRKWANKFGPPKESTAETRDRFETGTVTTRAAHSKGSTHKFTQGMVNATRAQTAKKELYEADLISGDNSWPVE